MDFNQRISALMQIKLSPMNWDSVQKECDRIVADNLYIPSGFLWAVEYARYQIEAGRANRAAALRHLKLAISLNPYSEQMIAEYRGLQTGEVQVSFVAMIVASGDAEPALELGAQLEQAGIEYVIICGADGGDLLHPRIMRVDVPAGFENMARKTVAGLTSIYENLSPQIGVLRLGEHMRLDGSPLLASRLAPLARQEIYAGLPTNAGLEHDRCRHWGKCANPVLNRRAYDRPFYRPWAEGDAYFLGAPALSKLVMSMIRFPARFDGEFYEDKLVGDVLMFEGTDLTPWQSYAEVGLVLDQVVDQSTQEPT